MKRIWQAYGKGRPLPGYLLAIASYTALVGVVSAAGRLKGVRLPDRFSLADTALVAVATHKASRLLTKEAVTSPLRAPFTRYEEPAGHAELKESVRSDHPAQHAIGELLTCPFCMSVWVASTLTAGQLLWPRATRTAMGALTALAGADALQLTYSALVDKTTGE